MPLVLKGNGSVNDVTIVDPGTNATLTLADGTNFQTANAVQVGGSAGAITVTGIKETKTTPAISAGTLSINCSAGNVFAVALNAAITTLSFNSVPASGTAYSLTLAFIADGTLRAVTWGTSVKWPAATAPTLTSTNGKVDVFVLTTWDGGTTWYAFVAGQNL